MNIEYQCQSIPTDNLTIDTKVPLTGNISLKIHEHETVTEVVLDINGIIKLHNDIKEIMTNRLLQIEE